MDNNSDIDQLSPVQAHGRRVFESTLVSAHALIAKGVPPGAVIAGLLGVITQIGNESCGPREMRRLLMVAAESNSDNRLDA